jgi:CheY-like chemotaxis protein
MGITMSSPVASMPRAHTWIVVLVLLLHHPEASGDPILAALDDLGVVYNLVMADGTRQGTCEKCDRFSRLSFTRDASRNQYRWLCDWCADRPSSRWSVTELAEIDRLQAEMLRQERHSQTRLSVRPAISDPAHRVMVVEDDNDIRTCVCTILEEEGYSTLDASNGRQALELLRREPRNPPCLILLDLMMPLMNGWEFYEHLSMDQSLSSINVVVMTAQTDYAQIGSLRLLRKPLHLEELISAVHEAC